MSDTRSRAGRAAPDPIAIVGMAALFPKAPDKEGFWRNILDRVDAVSDAPEDWHAELFLDPDSRENDRVYTARGGFLGDLARFDPLRHGVMPSAINGGEPDQFLALELATDAVEDAGFDLRPVPGERVAVILGRGTYINRGFVSVVQHGIMVDRFLHILRQLHPETTEEELADLKAQLKASLPPFNAEIAPALVPNLVSGRISNRLDFRGTNYIIDAACASSLIALERGVVDLRDGRCDMAIVGGVHASTPAPIYQIFCQLEALSRRGAIRPFSAEADGTLLGEGVGILCLKRLSDAEAAGDRIYALVRGVGVASDGRGLGILAPRLEGEALALSRAYEEAGVDPATVGLIEAHGTATRVGDATEIEALAGQFGPRRGAAADIALGAVKSMIGHCLPASGAAGLIKTALALYHRTLPPTLVETPNPALGLEKTRLYLNTEARPWIHGGPEPRRAGVNAFGFGGINAHAVLEEYAPNPDPAPVLTRTTEVMFLDAEGPEALGGRIAELSARLEGARQLSELAAEVNAGLGDGDWRAAVVARDAAEARAKLARIAEQIAKGKTRLRDRKGAYLSSAPLGREGKIAFMFPGEGSQHVGMLRELMLHFPVMRRWFDIVDGAFAGHGRGLLPSQVIFPPEAQEEGAEALWRMDIGPEAIFAANQAVAALYEQIGLAPDMLVGHSTGEYSALYAAGVTRREDTGRLQEEMRALNALYEEMEREGLIARGALVALGAVNSERLRARLQGREDLFLAMDNCPNQMVLAARDEAGREAAEALAAELGGFAEVLPFDRAYHSPAFARFSARLGAFLDTLEIAAPERPVYSCLSAAPFPADAESIRRLAAEQWSGTVRFAETIERMHADGARLFIECGPRNNLSAFVDDILRRKPHLALSVDTPARSGLEQFHHFIAQLAVEAVPFDPAAIAAPTPPRRAAKGPRRPQKLEMGIQPMRLDHPPKRPARPEPAAMPPEPTEAMPAAAPEAFVPQTGSVEAPSRRSEAGDPVLAAYFDTMERFVETEGEIMRAWLMRGDASASATPAAISPPTPLAFAPPSETSGTRLPFLSTIERDAGEARLTAEVIFSLETMPFLADHSFGGHVSRLEPKLTGLPVVPLTFSMEVLAEAAAALRPGLTVTGMRELRASRWLALTGAELRIRAEAEVLTEATETVIRVRLRAAEGPKLRPVLVEADVTLAASLPPAPPAPPIAHGARREVRWSREDVYSRIMFHGPMLQAVESMDLCAEDGAEGILRGMDHAPLLAATPAPRFETDAITLDAVGQLVGVWAAEMLPEAFHIFPFRVEKLELFRAPLAPGETARCRCRIELVGADEMRSDIDVVTGEGRLQCRIEGWWDKRFDLPERMFHARLEPATQPVSAILEELPGAEAMSAVRLTLVDDVSDELLEGSGGIWAEMLAGLVLSRPERGEWAALAAAVPRRRFEWLRGRIAAKDAVRALVGPPLLPADVQITPAGDETPPGIGGIWPEEKGARPLVSITHKAGIALAAAADATRYAGVGVDLEAVSPRDEAFVATAFGEAERARIAAAPPPERDRLIAQLWCAREAAAKSFGLGLAALDRFVCVAEAPRPGTIAVRDRQSGEEIAVFLAEGVGPGLVAALALRPRRPQSS